MDQLRGSFLFLKYLFGKIIPGFEKIGTIDQTKEEFHITGRILHSPEFPTTDGRATFAVCPMPQLSIKTSAEFICKLMTVRSEGQFNTVVYDKEDRYRGVKSRDIIFMNSVDIHSLSIQKGERVTVKNATGILDNQEVVEYPIKSGNVMMYYPEANILVPRQYDSKSQTPSFK